MTTIETPTTITLENKLTKEEELSYVFDNTAEALVRSMTLSLLPEPLQAPEVEILQAEELLHAKAIFSCPPLAPETSEQVLDNFSRATQEVGLVTNRVNEIEFQVSLHATTASGIYSVIITQDRAKPGTITLEFRGPLA